MILSQLEMLPSQQTHSLVCSEASYHVPRRREKTSRKDRSQGSIPSQNVTWVSLQEPSSLPPFWLIATRASDSLPAGVKAEYLPLIPKQVASSHAQLGGTRGRKQPLVGGVSMLPTLAKCERCREPSCELNPQRPKQKQLAWLLVPVFLEGRARAKPNEYEHGSMQRQP